MKLANYRTAAEQTDIESFSNGSDCVVIEWDGETRTIRTFTAGTSEPLYEGNGMDAARQSLELSESEWNELLASDVEYLEEV